jgi:hypothetical protein
MFLLLFVEQSQCKPSAESLLFAEVQPDFTVTTAKIMISA